MSQTFRPARPPARMVTVVVAALAVLLTVAGCTGDTVTGQAKSNLWDPDNVGGLPLTDGPSGLRADAGDPAGDVAYTNNGPEDRLAMLAVDDLTDYWKDHFDTDLDGTFRPVDHYASYDSRDPDGPELCGENGFQSPNAFFCYPMDLMAWDRGVLIPTGRKYFGDASIAGLIAHEYGHAVQRMAHLTDRSTPTLVAEQQADCFGGTYLRWVAEGKSTRFELNTGEGLTKVLAGVIAVRDPVWDEEHAEMVTEGHGTALDRVTAVQRGFVEGIGACARIDLDEIDARRGDLPILLQSDPAGAPQSGDIPLDAATMKVLTTQLATQFALDPAPAVSMTAPAAPCPDAQPTLGASYCPTSNTITLDLAALQRLGAAADLEQGVLVQGDNTAMSVVVSRYMLALQHQRGAKLDDATASLRTACLTGYAERHMVDPKEMPKGDSITLSAGDMDEAVAGLLNNGLAASDVNGQTVPAGFARVSAFRAGLLDDSPDACFTRFPSPTTEKKTNG